MGRQQPDDIWDLGTSVVAMATYVAPTRAEVLSPRPWSAGCPRCPVLRFVMNMYDIDVVEEGVERLGHYTGVVATVTQKRQDRLPCRGRAVCLV
jgi:hypothetical protein